MSVPQRWFGAVITERQCLNTLPGFNQQLLCLLVTQLLDTLYGVFVKAKQGCDGAIAEPRRLIMALIGPEKCACTAAFTDLKRTVQRGISNHWHNLLIEIMKPSSCSLLQIVSITSLPRQHGRQFFSGMQPHHGFAISFLGLFDLTLVLLANVRRAFSKPFLASSSYFSVFEGSISKQRHNSVR